MNYYLKSFISSITRFVPDELYLRVVYRLTMKGRKLHLNPPVTFNEKLHWLKIHDHNPLYTTLVDKYEMKECVSKIIGDEYIIPTIGVWDHVEDIDINSLPEQFVIKTTHDSGGVCVCKNKSEFDWKSSKKKLQRSLSTNFYLLGREWPYKNVKRRIIVEKYMEDAETKELRDYKFFCFEGIAKLMFIASGRQIRKEPYFDFYDMEFNHIDMRHGHPNAPTPPQKPASFDQMRSLSETICKELKLFHARVDFYEVNGQPYLGEITLYHHNGNVIFDPEEWDYKLGEWIDLSKRKDIQN